MIPFHPNFVPFIRNPNQPHLLFYKFYHQVGKRWRVLPDGNCFFRSLSFCFYQTEDHHLGVRQSVVTSNTIRVIMPHSYSVVQWMSMSKEWQSLVFGQHRLNYKQLLTATLKRFSCWQKIRKGTTINGHPTSLELARNKATFNLLTSLQFILIQSDVVTHKLPQNPPQLDGRTVYIEEVL